MAQVTAQTAGATFYAAVSTDGSSFTDISGAATMVEPQTAERKHGEGWTGEGDIPVLTYGKREPQMWELMVIYTKTAGQAYKLLHSAFYNNTRLDLRYCEEGNTTGNDRFTTSAGRVVELDFPKAEASEADPVVCKAVFKAADYTLDTVP